MSYPIPGVDADNIGEEDVEQEEEQEPEESTFENTLVLMNKINKSLYGIEPFEV